MKDNQKTLNDFIPKVSPTFYVKFESKENYNQISKDSVIEKIKTVMDPEIPVNLYDLGLIYKIEVDQKNNILVEMTLTNPNCPVAGTMPENVGKAVSLLDDILSVEVRLIWQPKWSKEMMSEDAKLALDIF